MADPTLDLLVRDPTHNRYMTVPTFADLAAAEELLVKGDFVKVLDSGDRYLVRGINQFEFLGNASAPVEGSGAGAAAAFNGWTPVIGELEDKALADTATSKQLGQGVRVQGQGIDE